MSRKRAGLIGCGSVGISFLITLTALVGFFLSEESKKGGVATLYNWVTAGSFSLNMSILVDPLSVFMLLIITGVGFVIHVYSIGYMEKDPEFSRFFSYLNFFIFSMSLLVLAADFFFLIVGWAFVGLASYLLIGFWKEKTSAVLAARKAFVMNVIGDVGMVIAAFIIFDHLGTLNFLEVFATAKSTFRPNDDAILLITMFLLVGAFAKSAQIPLHTWLADAMEGPTPVSALIHAATMVTAGVYLIARCHVLYELAPFTMYLISTVGAVTAIFAGSMAMVQYDIKRVIAYSTMSQLGFMFLAVGVGMYSIAMFHLMTHAFFKALLFLSAGSVIHGLNDEQDIRKMGGIRHSMPITHVTFLIGSLALAGFPLTSGFFSKEAIIINSYHADMGNIIFWAMAIIGAVMTGFYIFRVYFYVFSGQPRTDVSAHESPVIMIAPLCLLAFLSLTAGFGGGIIDDFLSTYFGSHMPHPDDILLETIGLSAGLIGIVGAVGFYMTGKDRLEFIKQMLAPLYDLLFNKYYIDEIYNVLIVKPTRAVGAFLEKRAEKFGFDFAVDQVGVQIREVSRLISLWQSGNVRLYAFNMIVGVVTILMFVVFL
jgi:NADH-quinone oxidoreductase subunit L